MGLLRHSEFLSLKSGSRKNVEHQEFLKFNFRQLSSLVTTRYEPQRCELKGSIIVSPLISLNTSPGYD